MANCFKIYHENLIDQAVITASTENAQFPLANLKDHRRSKVYRSTNSSTTIVLDFQESSLIDGAFIVPNKRDGFGVSTVTLEFNGVDNWAAPAYSIPLTFSTTLGIGHITFPQISYRFCRIVLTSALAYCEISKIFIGSEVAISSSINFGWTIKDEELSVKTKNRYGQIFADLIARQKAIGFAFKNIQKEDLELLNDMIDRVGETKPFYIAIGNNTMSADYRRFSGPVTLDDIPTITNSNFNRYNLSMAVKELM